VQRVSHRVSLEERPEFSRACNDRSLLLPTKDAISYSVVQRPERTRSLCPRGACAPVPQFSRACGDYASDCRGKASHNRGAAGQKWPPPPNSKKKSYPGLSSEPSLQLPRPSRCWIIVPAARGTRRTRRRIWPLASAKYKTPEVLGSGVHKDHRCLCLEHRYGKRLSASWLVITPRF